MFDFGSQTEPLALSQARVVMRAVGIGGVFHATANRGGVLVHGEGLSTLVRKVAASPYPVEGSGLRPDRRRSRIHTAGFRGGAEPLALRSPPGPKLSNSRTLWFTPPQW